MLDSLFLVVVVVVLIKGFNSIKVEIFKPERIDLS